MLAPVTGPPTAASSATAAPTVHGRPLRSATSSRKNVMTASSRNARPVPTAGTVTPRSPRRPNNASSRYAASAAPSSCAPTYGSARRAGNFPASVSAMKPSWKTLNLR